MMGITDRTSIMQAPDNGNAPQPELVEWIEHREGQANLRHELPPSDPRIVAQQVTEPQHQATEGQSQVNGHQEPPWWTGGLSADEFITAAQANYERGWHPIPVGKKKPDKPACKAPWLRGLTGTNGINAAPKQFPVWATQIQKWIETKKYDGILNLGIRMPVDVIGIDADGYGGKYGLQTIARLEHHWGTLPPTYYLTARSDGSRIRLYRAPDDWKGITNAVKLSWLKDDVPEGADLGVEIIQRHHRHVMAPPSVHHTGKRYQLFGPDDHVISSGVLPAIEDVPWLPELWCDGLYEDAGAGAGSRATSADVKEFAERWFYEDHPYNLETILNDLTAKFASNLKDTYGPMFSALCQAAREAKGHCFAWSRAEAEIQALAAKHYAQRGRTFDWENYNHAVNDAVSYAIHDEDEQKLIERYAQPWKKNSKKKNTNINNGDADEWFWTATPILADLRQFARARRVGPYAMLGCVLAKVASSIPPEYVLPALRGGHASLNFFVALVGPSGSSKSSSMAAANDWLNTDPNVGKSKPGSAEGLAKLYAYVTKQQGGGYNQIGKTWTVLASIPEVESLTVTANRGGNSIMAELRGAWCGERLGFDYAGDEKKIKIEDHRYRYSMIIGVQPMAAEALFKGSEVGTPQRILWMPTADMNAPEFEPEEPARLDLRAWPSKIKNIDPNISRNALLGDPHDGNDFEVLDIPESAKQVVRVEAVAALKRGLTEDSEDGHRNLLQLKVAALLMGLHGRFDKVSETDYELAGHLMSVSDTLRNEIQRLISTTKKIRKAHDAAIQGEMADVTENSKYDAAVNRVAENMVKKLRENNAEMGRAELRKKIAFRDRDYFDDGEISLIKSGLIEKIASENAGPDGFVLRLIGASN